MGFFKFISAFSRLVTVVLLFLAIEPACSAENVSAGFLFDQFNLTLEYGQRIEAAGPFFYAETNEMERTLAVPPLFSLYKNFAVDAGEFDLLYPALTCEHYGDEWRWQLGQLLSLAGGREPNNFHTRRFTIFPIYFQQRSLDTNLNYTAVVPFYGHLKNRLFRDEIFFVMFPVFGESRKKDIVTDNYFYPFFSLRHGDGLFGWKAWPFVGHEHKVVTTQTNGFGDVSIVGGHDHWFVLSPFWVWQNNGIGTDNPEKIRASIPFFFVQRSPHRDATSVFWPFFTWINEREKKYHEWQGPWPFVIFARGEGKTTTRVWPLFSLSHDKFKESDSYLWPLYRYKRLHSDPLDERKTSLFFYLYVNVLEKNTQTGKHKERVAMWPFFTWQRDFEGRERLQVFAPVEPALPNNRGIERNWSPLWSVWRAEKNPLTGADSESLLWNLYRREAAPGHKKISLLFGLFQYQRNGENSRTRLFYLTVARTKADEKADGK